MSDLKVLSKKVMKFVRDRDWKQFFTPKDLAIGLSLEAAEVMEHFRWKKEKETKAYIKTHKEEIADELADVLICLLVMARDFNIDMVRATENKLKKNAKKYPIEKSKGVNKKYTEF